MTQLLTIDTVRAEDLGHCVAHDWSATPQLLAGWSVMFGPVTQVLFLQSLFDGTGALPSLPAGPTTPQRRKRELIAPFSPHRRSSGGIGVLELRTYDVRAGLDDAFVGRMSAALPLRQRFSPNFGAWRSLTGRLGRVRHLWGYRDLAERDAVRARLRADADWGAYTAAILPMLESLTSTILVPLPRAGATDGDDNGDTT